MPAYKKRKYGASRSNYRRKPYTASKRSRVQGSKLSMQSAPLPSRLTSHMKYYDNVQIAAVTGTNGTYVFNAAGLFDPDVTGTGHQPRGFDQLMPLYENYTVVGAKITAKFMNSSAVNQTVGIATLQSTVTAPGLTKYMEGRWVTSRNIAPIASMSQTTLTATYSPKMIGYDAPLEVDNLKGTIATNPNEGTFFHLFNNDIDENLSGNVSVAVTIEYSVVFTDPVTPTES